MKGYWPKLENKISPPSTSPITKTKSEAKQSPQSTSTPAKPVKVEGVERAVEKYKEIEEEAERQTSKCSKRVFSVRISSVFFLMFFLRLMGWCLPLLTYTQPGACTSRLEHDYVSSFSLPQQCIVRSFKCMYLSNERTN